MEEFSVPVYNIPIKEWVLLRDKINWFGYGFWNVTDQWKRTEFATYYNKYNKTPVSMILLNHPKKFVILVWATGNWNADCIKRKHSGAEILSALPPLCAL